jgi:hypothetical protein
MGPAFIYWEWQLGRSITVIITGSVIFQFTKYEKIKCDYSQSLMEKIEFSNL